MGGGHVGRDVLETVLMGCDTEAGRRVREQIVAGLYDKAKETIACGYPDAVSGGVLADDRGYYLARLESVYREGDALAHTAFVCAALCCEETFVHALITDDDLPGGRVDVEVFAFFLAHARVHVRRMLNRGISALGACVRVAAAYRGLVAGGAPERLIGDGRFWRHSRITTMLFDDAAAPGVLRAMSLRVLDVLRGRKKTTRRAYRAPRAHLNDIETLENVHKRGNDSHRAFIVFVAMDSGDVTDEMLARTDVPGGAEPRDRWEVFRPRMHAVVQARLNNAFSSPDMLDRLRAVYLNVVTRERKDFE